MNGIKSIDMISQELLLQKLKNELPRPMPRINGQMMPQNDAINLTAIDLSRHCDSVETRTTPSPYSSSPFEQILNSLSSSSRTNSAFGGAHSDTNANLYHRSPLQHYSMESQFPIKNEPIASPMKMQVQNDHQSIVNDLKSFQERFENTSSVPSNDQLSSMFNLQEPSFTDYMRNPLTVPVTNSLTDRMSAERYNEFREKMLRQIYINNGGQSVPFNPKMRRNRKIPEQIKLEIQSHDAQNPTDANDKTAIKDSEYYTKRQKNNIAAKKSRDRRRHKEDEMAIRTAFLERENFELKMELEAARRQLNIYSHK